MSTIFRKVVYPLYHAIKRDGTIQAIQELDRSQWRSHDEILDLQQKKLLRLLNFAHANVPYYSNLFDKIGLSPDDLVTPENFSQIPILTKSLINENRDELVSRNLSGNGLVKNSTSGSTGESLYFYTDHNSTAYRKAAEIRGKSWTGWRIGDKAVSLWGSPIDQQKQRSIRGILHLWLTQMKSLSSYDLSPAKMHEYTGRIQKFRPVLFVSYPGPLEEFANFCIANSLHFPSLRGLITSAETLFPYQRELFLEAFGLNAFNRYGSREFGNIAQECDEHNGLHVSAERVFVEILNKQLEPSSKGEIGQLIITDLDNFGFPLIRYDIGDRSAWHENPHCQCERGLPRLSTIDGRTMDVIRTPSGKSIGGTYWTILLKSRPGLKQIQIVQDRLTGITIKYVRNNHLSNDSLDYFSKQIKEKCGSDFEVNFQMVESIEPTISGKQKLVVSRVT